MKHALRRLISTPIFTATALLTLGLALGANGLIFSVVNGVLLKPLPFADPDRLVGVWHVAPGIMAGDLNQGPATYLAYREDKVFQDIGMWDNSAASVTGRGEPERVDTLNVTDGTLPLLGVQPALGRLFTAADDAPGSAPTVVLSHEYWQRLFAGRPDAIGQSLVVDGEAREVIGVLPPRFRFVRYRPSLILPFRINRAEVFVGNFSYQALARLKPGQTIEEASAHIARIIPTLKDRFPMPPGFTPEMFAAARLGPNVRPLVRDVIGDVANVLWVLLGTVAIVLLVACANIASLFLVRAESRQRELAVRVAMGASRRQVIGELFSEALVLSVAAGVLGIGLTAAGIRLLVALNPSKLPRLDEIALDPLVVVFVFGAAVAAGLLFGLIPIAKYATPQLATALKDGSRGSSDGRERHRARNTLVVAQVALALVLLVGSGLLVRTFVAMRNVSPGFSDPQDVLTLRIAIPDAVVADKLAAFATHEEILRRIQEIPGVVAAGQSSSITMDGLYSNDPIFAEDRPMSENTIPPLRRYKWIGPGYFGTMGNPVVAGRDFTWQDLHARTPVVIISAAMARELWGSPAAALGKRVRNAPKNQWREVVGVVGDEHDDGVARPATTIAYWPMVMDDYWDQPLFVQRYMSYAIRSPRVRTGDFLGEVQKAVWAVNPNLPLARVSTLQDIYDGSLAETQFALVILGIAASVTLLLGVVGLYGVVAYTVVQRRREVGIRIALGAGTDTVQGMFVRQGLRLVGIGLVAGAVIAAAVTRVMAALLFGVSPVDPLTYVAVAAMLGSVALVAAWLPARQAARVDPAIALRAD